MKFLIHRNFRKSSKKLSLQLKLTLRDRLKIFSTNPDDERLDNHALQGKYLGHRSIRLTGDWRIVFKEINENTVLLVRIGTHSQLYG